MPLPRVVQWPGGQKDLSHQLLKAFLVVPLDFHSPTHPDIYWSPSTFTRSLCHCVQGSGVCIAYGLEKNGSIRISRILKTLSLLALWIFSSATVRNLIFDKLLTDDVNHLTIDEPSFWRWPKMTWTSTRPYRNTNRIWRGKFACFWLHKEKFVRYRYWKCSSKFGKLTGIISHLPIVFSFSFI